MRILSLDVSGVREVDMAYTLAELFVAVYERDSAAERPEVREAALATEAEALSEEWRGVVEGRRRRRGR